MPIQLPIGEEKRSRASSISSRKKAYIFETNESGKFKESAVPADMAAPWTRRAKRSSRWSPRSDEKLMEKFFEAGTLTDEELVSGLRSATAAAKFFPLVCTSALVNIGVPQLLDAIVNYLPSPADARSPASTRPDDEVVTGRREEAAAGVRLEDHRRSVRRPHHDVPRHGRAR